MVGGLVHLLVNQQWVVKHPSPGCHAIDVSLQPFWQCSSSHSVHWPSRLLVSVVEIKHVPPEGWQLIQQILEHPSHSCCSNCWELCSRAGCCCQAANCLQSNALLPQGAVAVKDAQHISSSHRSVLAQL